MKRSREALSFFLLLILGLAPRLALVSSFPTIPVSDAAGLVAFGVHLRDNGLLSPVRFWEQFNLGLPLSLCGLFHLFPHADPNAVARVATACVCGLVPVVPFLIWRGVLPLWVRMLAGGALALWPGQVVFSGAVFQDNWVILPSVALGAVAVRSLLSDEPPHVVAAGLLYAAGIAYRQEMLVSLLPLFLTVVSTGSRMTWRRAAAAGLALGLPLLALAAYRDAVTGHFAITTPHGGITVLGSYIPGAGANGWTHPGAYISAVQPDLLLDRAAYFSQSWRLVAREALRRPAFHAARIVALAGTTAVTGESDSLHWTLLSPEVLPPAVGERGGALGSTLEGPLRWEMPAILGLFLAATVVGFRRRGADTRVCRVETRLDAFREHVMPATPREVFDAPSLPAGTGWAILVLASAVLLKYGLHAVTVVFGRFLFVSSALEILAIALAAYELRSMAPPERRRLAIQALAFGGVIVTALVLFAPRLQAVVSRRDVDPQRTYRFQLEPPDHSAALACVVDRGLLEALDWNRYAILRTRSVNPAPGDQVAADCELTGRGEPQPLMLQMLDSYAAGGLPGRMVQEVAVDGGEAFSHDIAQPAWSGWTNIPLGNVGIGTKRKVVIDVRAIHPEAGWGWGAAATTRLQLASAPTGLNLALAKPAAQSSDLAGNGPTGAEGAVDGNTDGKFAGGSVTATNADANAWWEVDLGASVPIGSIVIWNRTDCCGERLEDFWVFLSDTPFRPTDTPAALKGRAGTWSSHQVTSPHPSVAMTPSGAAARYLRVQLSGRNYLSLAEVQVFGQ